MGRSSLLRCTTSLSPRLSPETTLASTSRTSLSRTSREDTSPLTPRTSPPLVWLTSPPRSSSLTTPDRFPTATAPSLIATPLTLLASLPRSRRRLTVVPVSQLRTTPSSSSLVTPPSSEDKYQGWHHQHFLVGHGVIKSDEREIFPVKDLGHIDLVFWFSGRRKLSIL